MKLVTAARHLASIVLLPFVVVIVVFRSCILAGWSVVFVLINHVYFILLEEPGLERRFGQAYVEYRNQVPQWILRLRSWFDPRSHAS